MTDDPMTEGFVLHDETTAPAAARDALAATRASFGMLPNLERVMAGAPALLASYSAAWELFDQTSLSPVERQVVYQTANFANDCTYCVPWHTLLSEKAGMAPEVIAALRAGSALPDARLDALHRFARRLIDTRGKLDDGETQAFFAAGYEPQQAMEVVLGLAIKLMSNFTNSIAGTPLDAVVQGRAWTRPAGSAA